MSAHRHQRKQELLESLAVSRLELLDEVESISRKVEKVLSFPGKFGVAVKNHPVASSTGAVLGGLVVVKLLASLFHSSRSHHEVKVDAAELHRKSVVQTIGGSLWGMLIAAAAPTVKDWAKDHLKRGVKKAFSSKD